MSSPILNSLVIKARHVSSISPKKSSLLFRHGFESSNSAGYQASIESEYLSGDNNKTRLAFKTYGGGNTTNTDDVKMTISETGVVNIYGSLDMNGGKISNLGTPVNAGDATTKGYVDGAIGTLTTNVGKLDTSMGLVEGEIGILSTNVGKLDTSMGLVESEIGTLTTNVGKLDTSMGLVEGEIGTLTTNVGKLDTSMGLVESEIGTLTTNVGKLDTSMGLVEGEIGILTTNVGKLDTSMGLVESEIGTLTTNVGKLDTSMGLVESEIGTLTTNVGKLDTSMGLVVFQENGVLLSDLSANGFKIKSLADPVDNQDAATKVYVDGILQINRVWVDEISNRALNTVYTNTTGYPLIVNWSVFSGNDSTGGLEVIVNGIVINGVGYKQDTSYIGSFEVPNNNTYRIATVAPSGPPVSSIQSWCELKKL
jgi:hypothetical protein